MAEGSGGGDIKAVMVRRQFKIAVSAHRHSPAFDTAENEYARPNALNIIQEHTPKQYPIR